MTRNAHGDEYLSDAALTMGFATARDTDVAEARLTPAQVSQIAGIGPISGIGALNSQAKGSGARFNNGKPDLSLLPLTMVAAYYARGLEDQETPNIPVMVLEALGAFQETHDPGALDLAFSIMGDKAWPLGAQVFDYGTRKYNAWNWAKGMPWSVPLACAARHLISILEGEEIDIDKPGQPGSKLPHYGHVQCNLVMLRQYVDTYPEGNDLPPVGLLGAA